ncbi:hypothetical protein BST61_g4014 [Cercospora zeina]
MRGIFDQWVPSRGDGAAHGSHVKRRDSRAESCSSFPRDFGSCSRKSAHLPCRPGCDSASLQLSARRKSGAAERESGPISTTVAVAQPSTAARQVVASQVRHQSSSTSAIAYKALHRRIAPLPTAGQPGASSISPAAAVSSILYETPLPDKAPPKRHVLNCLVQNEPGVLSRVSGILAARGFNIDSLVVCSTEVADLSRMTIVLQGQDGVVEQARRQLEDLVPVWAVLDYTQAPLVQRELLLAKISILGPEYFEELLAHHREMTGDATYGSVESGAVGSGELGNIDGQPEATATSPSFEEDIDVPSDIDFHPRNLAPSEALRMKHQHLETITYLTHQFGGKVLDISTNNCIIELSAKPNRVDSFMKLISPFGILESARTGLMALPRSPLEGGESEQTKEVEEVMDAAALPPS